MSPFDLTDRRAAGHPNGHCSVCGRPAVSLKSDYCSTACRSKASQREAKEEYWEQQRLEYERAQATVIPDEELAKREPERPEPPAKPEEAE